MRILLVLCLALAGCADPPTPADGFADLESDADVGVVRGVVFDGAILPMEGVEVSEPTTGLTTATDDQGRFILVGFAPGTYFLDFSLTGYADVQTSAAVEASQEAPILKVQMQLQAGTEPFIEAMQWNGHIECSWFVVAAFYTGCGIGDVVGDQSRRFDMIDARPQFVQSELDWTPTQVAGTNLCMRHYASSGVGGDILGDVCGASPLTFPINATVVEQTGLGNTRGLERVVWVASWTQDAPTAGIAVDQPFAIYTHLFFNFEPEDGWTFLADGTPTPA